MKRKKKGKADAVNVSYRVECNCGSKYFTDEAAAEAYFEYMSARGFEAELWVAGLLSDINGTVIKGEQRLLALNTVDGFTRF